VNLYTDYPRPGVKSFEGRTLDFELGNRETTLLKSFSLEQDATLYMVLLAAFTLLLTKLSGQEEIVIGSPVECRKHEDLRQIIGMFINMLAMKNVVDESKRVPRFLEEVKRKALAAFDNQEYPFDELVERVTVKRDAGRNPLFDVIFTFQKTVVSEINIPGLKLMPYEQQRKIAKFDLGLMGTEVKGNAVFSLEYCTRLFKQETVEGFIRYFKRILTQIIEEPDREISTIEIISEQEKRQVLVEFNDTGTGYPCDK
ncbi:MAG: hypothetical protein GY757_29635, partial [bacterium]|nr:hypothetical protein [bacterium]